MGKKMMRALVIGAHSDDESLYVGGTLLKLRPWVEFTFICCTGLHEEERKAEFEASCAFFADGDPDQGHAVMLNTLGFFSKNNLRELRAELKAKRIEDWPVIVTHSTLGELNQEPDHRFVNYCVRKHLQEVGYTGMLLTFGIGTQSDVLVYQSREDQDAKRKWLDKHPSQRWYLREIMGDGIQNLEGFRLETINDIGKPSDLGVFTDMED